jgi:2-succinyl-5-enolpyruvyl-6-hydroxy-3-cyclohexene-1-carboxylate synthase
VNLAGIASAFGVNYEAVNSVEALLNALEGAVGSKIIDSKTEQHANLAALVALR